MRRPPALAVLALAAALAACEGEPASPPPSVPVTAAEVERVRAMATPRARAIDGAIADLETRAQATDSVEAAAYEEALERLREERQDLQEDLDALPSRTASAFADAEMEVEDDLSDLDWRLARAQVRFARDAAELRQGAEAALAQLGTRIGALENTNPQVAALQQEHEGIVGFLTGLGEPAAVALAEARVELDGALDRLDDGIDRAEESPAGGGSD